MPAIPGAPKIREQLEATYTGPLTPVQMQVIALLIEGGRTMEQLAQEIGSERETIWRWRKKPEFQAEYLKQLRATEQAAFDYGISRRVERIAALNDTWVKLRKQLDKSRTPRTDHIYALIALQTAAAKELGQHSDNIQIGGHLAITQQVNVIRFEAMAPRNDLEGEVLEADFAEIPSDPLSDSEPTDTFDQALASAGVTSIPGRLDSEHAATLRRAIDEMGIDPATVLLPEQLQSIYGEE